MMQCSEVMVTRLMLHEHSNIEMDTTRKHMINSIKYTRHVCWTLMSDTTQLHNRRVHATLHHYPGVETKSMFREGDFTLCSP